MLVGAGRGLPAGRPAVTPGPFSKSERPQRKAKVADDAVVIHGKGGKKNVWSEVKGFRIVLKIRTEIYSKDALVMLRCQWIWSL